jgi:hypothetical protein
MCRTSLDGDHRGDSSSVTSTHHFSDPGALNVRIEYVPVILGVIVVLLGLALIGDAWIDDAVVVSEERRRRARTPRSRPGEALVGMGTTIFGMALIGRDTWRFATLAVLIGAPVLLIGVILNWRYLRELLTFRGPARRDPTTDVKPGMPENRG